MNYTCSAPARQAVPELPEHNLPGAPRVKKTSQGSGNLVAYVRLLWEHRRVFARVALGGLLASTLLVFLIPVRFECTTRLMPPESSQSGASL